MRHFPCADVVPAAQGRPIAPLRDLVLAHRARDGALVHGTEQGAASEHPGYYALYP